MNPALGADCGFSSHRQGGPADARQTGCYGARADLRLRDPGASAHPDHHEPRRRRAKLRYCRRISSAHWPPRPYRCREKRGKSAPSPTAPGDADPAPVDGRGAFCQTAGLIPRREAVTASRWVSFCCTHPTPAGTLSPWRSCEARPVGPGAGVLRSRVFCQEPPCPPSPPANQTVE